MATLTSAMRMELLCKQFRSLHEVPGAVPWDSLHFLEHACSKAMSHGELLVVRFVLGVWNSSTDWPALAREFKLPYPDHAARFDILEAWAVCDEPTRAVVLAWLKEPFWP